MTYTTSIKASAAIHSNKTIRDMVIIDPGNYEQSEIIDLLNGEQIISLNGSNDHLIVRTYYGLTPFGKALGLGQ